MFENLPGNVLESFDWGPEKYTPYFEALEQVDLTENNIDEWMLNWSKIAKFIFEVGARLRVAITVDTHDTVNVERFKKFAEHIRPVLMTKNQILTNKLLQSGLKPENFEVPLKKLQVEVELFRAENLPLMAQQQKLGLQYDEIVAAQTVEWEGEELTLTKLNTLMTSQDRDFREKVWRAGYERRLQDRDALNDLWVKLLKIREQIAVNADKPDYRAYAWLDRQRMDYTPEDNMQLHESIEKVVVPAATRLLEKYKAALKVDTLRPWDIDAGEGRSTIPDPHGRDPLKPYTTSEELETGVENILKQVSPKFAEYFGIMRDERLLDLDNRKGKAPGGYNIRFPATERTFIFMNGVGVHGNIRTLLHECGHAFHTFESMKWPYVHQGMYPPEFAEVAAMTMELLGSPYMTNDYKAFYTEQEAARARIEHLQGIIMFWPYMAVVDGFQHWVYTHTADAADPAKCDAKWGELIDRFIPAIDYTGLDDVKVTGWHRKLHIFQIPFYYVEYGLAQLGAVQIWANSLQDEKQAVQQYHDALKLGGTRSIPDLYAAAGAKLAFDEGTLGEAVNLIEKTIGELEAVQ